MTWIFGPWESSVQPLVFLDCCKVRADDPFGRLREQPDRVGIVGLSRGGHPLSTRAPARTTGARPLDRGSTHRYY
jgi:hypothetical protein